MREEPLEVTLSEDGGITVLEVAGELVEATGERLSGRLEERLAAGARKFVIDFESTTYMDSSGLGILVALARRVREEGGELRLSALRRDLRTLFEITNLDSVLRLTENRAAALAALADR